MARAVADIQAEIDAVQAELATVRALSLSADGASKNRERRLDLRRELNELQFELCRANGSSPMMARPRLGGIGRRF